MSHADGSWTAADFRMAKAERKAWLIEMDAQPEDKAERLAMEYVRQLWESAGRPNVNRKGAGNAKPD